MTADLPELPSTPAYAAVLKERREELQRHLDRILTPGTAFLLEVGSGHGHFLTAYAAAHPDKVCVGIDLVGERVQRAVRKRDRARLSNLHFLRAEARLFLQVLPLGPRISEVFILFPDPWPKLRHHKHRVLKSEFLAEVAGRAAPGCRLYFRTDYLPYFEDARAVVRESAQWQLLDAAWPFEYETVFQARAETHASLVGVLRQTTGQS